MKEQERPTITLNDQEYFVDELPEEAQYVVSRLQETSKHRDSAAKETELYNMAIQGYLAQLQNIMAPEKPEEPDEVIERPVQRRQA